MKDVVLIVPPFYMGGKPTYAASLLKSIISEAGYRCTILYANLLFKKTIDPRHYEKFSLLLSCNDIIEIIFATRAFPQRQQQQEKYLDKLRILHPGLHKKIKSMRQAVPALIRKVCEIIEENNPGIIWLYSFVKQMTASIALANALKKRNPRLTICLGGHSSQRPMAEELSNIAPSIDYIFNGEPELEFKNFCIHRLGENNKWQALYPNRIIDCAPVCDLDTLPFPDFHDYFTQSRQSQQDYKHIGFETNRGCFMGEWVNNRYVYFAVTIPAEVSGSEKRALAGHWRNCIIL